MFDVWYEQKMPAKTAFEKWVKLEPSPKTVEGLVAAISAIIEKDNWNLITISKPMPKVKQ